MSMSGLRLAPVIAVFLACVPAPTLAQSLEQGYHYRLSTDSQSVQNSAGGGTNLLVERVIERGTLKPWGVQLSAGFSRERVLAAYAVIATRYATLLEGKDAVMVSSPFRSRGTEPFYQLRVGTDTFESANDLCGQIRRAGAACMVLRNRLNEDDMDGSVTASAIHNVKQF
jgi:SPOR domain